jgi:cation-transporting ATPase 13A1
MSTIAALPNGKLLCSVKGAPETIRDMLESVPAHYDETYKWFTRNGSRVLALGIKEIDPLSNDKVSLGTRFGWKIVLTLRQINKLPRTAVEGGLKFAGFLVFHCPLKKDAVEVLKMLSDASHRVCPFDPCFREEANVSSSAL